MTVELAPSPVRMRFPAISWPAIFAALAVGIAVQLLLTVAGAAAGVIAAERGVGSGETITLAAVGWSAISMLIAALLGGYVAGRASGLRRTGDGVMHGLVSWAASTVLYAALATTAIGSLTTGLFGMLAPSIVPTSSTARAPAPASGDQSAQGMSGTTDPSQQQMRTPGILGVTPEQAGNVVDRMFRGGRASATVQRSPGDVARNMGGATLWLAGTALLSLLLAILGGMGGARAMRRTIRPIRRQAARSEPRVWSRT